MALTVGELVAYIRADGTQFDRQVDQSERKFAGLGTTVRNGVKLIAGSLTAVAGAGAGLTAAVFKIGADYNRLQQSSRAALTTLLGSAEAANAQMDKLDTFAKTSPFAKQVFITAQQQLLGFGVQADKVLPTLDAIQNAVAAVGGSNDQVSQVTYALAQMQGQGKLTGETLNQLGQYGIDAATILGRELGKTGQEIRELASKPGGIPVDKVWDPLVDGLMQRFGGATAGIKEQMDGALDRIKGAWRDIGSILAAPFIDPQGGGRAVEWANKVADGLRALEQKAKPAVDLLVSRFAPGLDRVNAGLDRVRATVNLVDLSKLNGQLDRIGQYGPLVAATSTALLALGGNSIGLGRLGLSLNPVVAGIAALVAASPELRSAGRDVLDTLSPLLPLGRELGRVLADTAMTLLRELTPAARDLLLAAADVATTLGVALTPALINLIQGAVPVAQVLADIVQVIADLPTPVLAAVTAFAGLVALGNSSAFTGLAGQLKVVNERMVLQAALAQASGTQVGKMGALAGVAQTQVSRLGLAMKAAFITNPIGLIITGIATAIGFFAEAQQKARAAAEAHADQVQRLADALRQSGGAIGDTVRDFVAQELAATKVTKANEDMLAVGERLGVNLEDVRDAWLGDAAAMQRVRDQLAAVSEETEKRFVPTSGATYDVLTDNARAAREYIEELERGADRMDEASEYNRRLAKTAGESTDATKRATDAEKERVDQLQKVIDKQREAAGAATSQRDAEIRAAESRDRLTELIKEGAKVTRDASGAVDDNAKSTIDVDKALLDLVGTYTGVTDAMSRNNATAETLDETIRQQRESFVKAATDMDYTAQEAERLADTYGLIPNRVSTEIELNTAKAEEKLGRFKRALANASLPAYYSAPNNLPGGGQANGGLWDGKVRTFADGGMNLAGQAVARVPQIAKGGQNITWAEPETGWEAYISGKPGMRARNLAILDETARRLGVRMVQLPTQHAADGLVAGPAPASTGPASVAGFVNHGTVITQDVDELARRTREAQTDALRKFGIMP